MLPAVSTAPTAIGPGRPAAPPLPRAVLLVLLAAAAGCAGLAAASAVGVPVDRSAPTVRRLPAGTVVRLRSAVSAEEAGLRTPAVDGLWREALRQSTHLDIAAGPTAAPQSLGVAVALTVDAAARALTATLHEDREGPAAVHLAAVTFAEQPLAAAIDELAVRTRLSLGDPVESAPLPMARGYSGDLAVVAACELAIERAEAGRFEEAAAELAAARPGDGGCTPLLEALAAARLVPQGHGQEAVRIAREALQLTDRLLPATAHRLMRTLLLARASTQPERTAPFDEELRTLGEVGRRERPHDPEPLLTAGLAANFLGEFDAARAVLAPLAQRLPGRATVHYHLGWAELGCGDGRAAFAAFERAARDLPLFTTVVPRALSLFAAGEHEQLVRLLDEVAAEPAVRGGAALHEVRRMQAAHALLCDDPGRAADLILADLTWMLERPSMLRGRAGELASAGEVLVRIGRGADLEPILASIERLDTGLALDPALGEVTAYLVGLSEAAGTGRRAVRVEDALRQRGATVWEHALCAFGHRQQGELADERAALTRAAQQSSSPLVKAALVRNLRAAGHTAEAEALRDALRRELERVDLRRRSQHPLLSPEHALAWLVE